MVEIFYIYSSNVEFKMSSSHTERFEGRRLKSLKRLLKLPFRPVVSMAFFNRSFQTQQFAMCIFDSLFLVQNFVNLKYVT